jgi:hypothetical protein
LNGQFYCDQVVELENPKQVGTYSYQTKEKEVFGTTVGGDMKNSSCYRRKSMEQAER